MHPSRTASSTVMMGLGSLVLASAAAASSYTTSDADLTVGQPASANGWAEAVTIVPDFDGDGVKDLLIGAVSAAPLDGGGQPLNNAGATYLVSGADGGIIRIFAGRDAGATMGFDAIAVPDRNGDGVMEVLSAAPRLEDRDTGNTEVGGIQVFSGADGSYIETIQPAGLPSQSHLGWSMRSLGDMNGDGIAELAAGAPGNAGPGFVVLFDGSSFEVLRTFEGEKEFAGFGWSVESAGDANGDGTPDLLIGAPFQDIVNNDPDPMLGGADLIHQDAGRAYLYSGSDYALIRTLERHDTLFPHEALTPFQNFGTRVDTVGDIDGDGRDDQIIGAPQTAQGSGGPGHVTVYSGATGDIIYDIMGPNLPSEKHGERVMGTGDIDGDGTPDFAASSAQTCWMFPGCGGPGQVIVYSGATGSPMHTYAGSGSNAAFGASMDAGDVDGDGGIDLVFGSIFSNPAAVYLYLGTPSFAPADLDQNGVVNVFDLLQLLGAWGECGGCPEDLDGSGAVNVFDLLALLGQWG